MKKLDILTLVLVFIALTTCSYQNAKAADDNDLKYNLTLLGPSTHHVDNGETNESHNGFGFSVTLPNNATYGVMRYTNSYGDTSTLLSLSTEFYEVNDFHLGAGVGYVTGYGDNLTAPVLGWASVRYGWIVVSHVPGQVTTLGASIPLEELLQ